MPPELRDAVFPDQPSWCYHSDTLNPVILEPRVTASTTLKLPEKLKARVARIAKESGRSPHGVMVEAIEREVERTERYRRFVKDALAADKAIDAGAAVYGANDVHLWLERLARDGTAERPKPWRR